MKTFFHLWNANDDIFHETCNISVLPKCIPSKLWHFKSYHKSNPFGFNGLTQVSKQWLHIITYFKIYLRLLFTYKKEQRTNVEQIKYGQWQLNRTCVGYMWENTSLFFLEAQIYLHDTQSPCWLTVCIDYCLYFNKSLNEIC